MYHSKLINPFKISYKVVVGTQDSIQRIFEGRIFTITGDLKNSTLFSFFPGMFFYQSKY